MVVDIPTDDWVYGFFVTTDGLLYTDWSTYNWGTLEGNGYEQMEQLLAEHGIQYSLEHKAMDTFSTNPRYTHRMFLIPASEDDFHMILLTFG